MSHGQNLSSTSGEPEFVVQVFFETPASVYVSSVDGSWGRGRYYFR
jgi:hypothetical protein